MILNLRPQDIADSMNLAMPEPNPLQYSVHEYFHRVIGHRYSKAVTLNANNTSASVNCFKVVNGVEVLKLYGFLTAVTTLTNCTAMYFDLWDGTLASTITKTTGAVLSGYSVGSYFSKDLPNTSELVVQNASAGRVFEQASSKAFHEFKAVPKYGVDTFIRFNYTTTDAPANAVVTVYCEARSLDSGYLVVV